VNFTPRNSAMRGNFSVFFTLHSFLSFPSFLIPSPMGEKVYRYRLSINRLRPPSVVRRPSVVGWLVGLKFNPQQTSTNKQSAFACSSTSERTRHERDDEDNSSDQFITHTQIQRQ
jgi:hypothetical protein